MREATHGLRSYRFEETQHTSRRMRCAGFEALVPILSACAAGVGFAVGALVLG